MTVTLTPEQEATLKDGVRDGRFTSQMDAVRVAFDLLISYDQEDFRELERIKTLRKRNLAEVLSEYPWANADVDVQRDTSPMRSMDL